MTRPQHYSSPVRQLRFLFAVLTATVLLVLPRIARADFTGPYDLPPGYFFLPNTPPETQIGQWTLSHGDSPYFAQPYVTTSPSQAAFDTGGPIGDHATASETIQLSITIAASGLLGFDYQVSRIIGPGIAANNDLAGYFLNGIFTQLDDATGSVQDVAVEEGDSFSFYVYAGPQCLNCHPGWGSRTEMAVTNFNAPIPEPSAALLLLVALLPIICFAIRARASRLARNVARKLGRFCCETPPGRF